ncbi:MAG: hypothetical protein ABWY11_26485, partial [Umezawaea sp.]
KLALGLLDKVFNVTYALRPLGDRAPDYLSSLITHVEVEKQTAPPGSDVVAGVGEAAPVSSGHETGSAGSGTVSARVYSIPAQDFRQAPTRLLRITQRELDLLRSLAHLLNDPRAVKKLTNVYRLILVGEHNRRTHYLNGEYQAAGVLAAFLVRAPQEFSALVEHLEDVKECDHDTDAHSDIRTALESGESRGGLARRLSRCVADQVATDPDFLICADQYRTWAHKVSRYGFETYKHYTGTPT